jgi:hypothetical protein
MAMFKADSWSAYGRSCDQCSGMAAAIGTEDGSRISGSDSIAITGQALGSSSDTSQHELFC